jgi:hypothetical protein
MHALGFIDYVYMVHDALNFLFLESMLLRCCIAYKNRTLQNEVYIALQIQLIS